ncbi:MAG: rubrerythrin family protein [Smithellaceae bacterium]|nr:rubrerythrin family protein [Smithellaceae bacterium]
MKRVTVLNHLILIVFLVAALVLAFSGSGVAANSKTMDNLLAAYNGESNAHAKYLEYARQADKEGYFKVANLFRAAAKAEEIHLSNHAQVIESMGVKPKADIRIPEIKSTRENLEDAIKGESYERDVMYPEFIAQAQREKNADALRSLIYAKAAEAEHAKLYKAALDNMDEWRAANAEFSVCPTCGFTVADVPEFRACPVCATSAKLYEVAS